MKAEHLKAWLQAEIGEKYPGTEVWDKVVSVIQVAFREGYINNIPYFHREYYLFGQNSESSLEQ